TGPWLRRRSSSGALAGQRLTAVAQGQKYIVSRAEMSWSFEPGLASRAGSKKRRSAAVVGTKRSRNRARTVSEAATSGVAAICLAVASQASNAPGPKPNSETLRHHVTGTKKSAALGR